MEKVIFLTSTQKSYTKAKISKPETKEHEFIAKESNSSFLAFPNAEKASNFHSTTTTPNSKINKTKKSTRNKLRLWITNIE